MHDTKNWSCGKCDLIKMGLNDAFLSHFRTCKLTNLMTKEKTITVPRAWFERLDGLVKVVEQNKHNNSKAFQLDLLLGYCSSAENILKMNK